ncbi:MAG: hypothetical protein PHW50_01210 [Patescibacteria group bacterium]|nr:hypothetical protein [Patescibacteria group bacterium]
MSDTKHNFSKKSFASKVNSQDQNNESFCNSRTLLPQFFKCHNSLNKKFHWYNNWHKNKYCYLTHVGIFIIFLLSIGLFASFFLSANNLVQAEKPTSKQSIISQLQGNFFSEDGFKKIVNLEENKLVGSHRFKAKLNSTETYFEFLKNRSADLYWIKTNLKEAIIPTKNPKKEKDKIVEPTAKLAKFKDKENIKWDEVYESTAIEQSLYEGKIKEIITLLNDNAPHTFIFDLTTHEDLVAKQEGETIIFSEKSSNEIVAQIVKPVTKDANGQDVAFKYTLDGSTLTLSPDQDLTDISYPLYIDPTYVVENNYGWTYNPSQRHLVRNSSGKLYAGYTRVDGEGFYTGYVAKSIDNGQTWTSEVACQGSAQLDVNNIALAIDAYDNLHVVMEVWDYDVNRYQARYRKYIANTGLWSAIENVGLIIGHDYAPTIAIDASQNVHIAFVAWGNVSYSGFYHQVYTDSWQEPTQIASGDTGDYGGNLISIAFDSENNIHFAWDSCPTPDYNSYVVRYRKLSSELEPIVTIANDTNYQAYWIQVAIDNNNYVHLVWDGTTIESPDNYQVRYRKFTDSWQPIVNLTNDPDKSNMYSSIAVDENNSIHVAWSGDCVWSPGYISENISYRKFTDSWQDAQVIFVGQGFAPSLISTQFPQVRSTKTNIPKSGFAFVFGDRTNQQIKYHASSDLTWQNPLPSTYSISGKVSEDNVGLSGVTISYGSKKVVTNANGFYTISSVANGNYTLIPSLDGYFFEPVNKKVLVAGANISGQNFIASAKPVVPPITPFSDSELVPESEAIKNIQVSKEKNINTVFTNKGNIIESVAGEVVIEGAGIPEAKVTVEIDKQTLRTVVNQERIWRVVAKLSKGNYFAKIIFNNPDGSQQEQTIEVKVVDKKSSSILTSAIWMPSIYFMSGLVIFIWLFLLVLVVVKRFKKLK